MTWNKAQFYLAIAAMIILFDVIASFASKSFGFDYTNLAWVSLCLYLISGYLGCKFYGLLGGILAGLVAGIADSTIGWALSSVIKPYISFEQPDYTFPLILEIIATISLGALIFGLIGALLFLIVNRFRRVT